MEREVASGMLATRLAESVPYWNRNRCVSKGEWSEIQAVLII